MSKKTIAIPGFFGVDLHEKDTLVAAFARVHAGFCFAKGVVFEVPVKAVCCLILLAMLVASVVAQHIRWEYSYWTGWREELGFWFSGAFALVCLLLLLPIQLCQHLTVIPRQ